MKNCILFIGDLNNKSLKEVNRIKESCNIDIVWCHKDTDKRVGISKESISKFTVIEYNEQQIEIKSNKGFYNYYKILNNPIFSEYDYVYVMHSEVHYSGKYSTMFAILNSDESDFIGPSIMKYPAERSSKWMWINEYLDHKKMKTDEKIKYFLSSYIKFYRLSKNALKFINNYKKCDIIEANEELVVPTLLYNYGFSCTSFTSDMSDKEFIKDEYIQIGNSETFKHGVTASEKEKNKLVRKYSKDLLFCGWNDESKDILRDWYVIGNEYKKEKIKYSVIIPVKNNADTLKVSIDSIINTYNDISEIEIIIVDESSTDDPLSVIEEYAEYNVIYAMKDANGLGDTINIGWNLASGPYIFIHMPNSIMNPSRISVQISEMETKNYDITVCSTDRVQYSNKDIDNSNIFDLDTKYDIGGLCFKRNLNGKIMFEEYFKDMCRKFIATHICGEFKYKCGLLYSQLETYINKQEWNKITDEDREMVYKCYNYFEDEPELTCIITFRNEGIEVEKTVQSIRATAANVAIILVNDASDKDIENYKWVAEYYHCKLITHSEAIGCGPSRDDGVANTSTPYFLLLDSHMRFYEQNWDIRLVKLIKKYPNSIISSQTSIIWKNKDGYYTNEDGLGSKANTMCCTFSTDPSKLFDVTWTTKYVSKTEDKELYKVYCVLGAGYCSSVEHWNNIMGLKGLGIYGLDEGLMSFKTYAIGGNCYILKDFRIGHVYRASSPFPNSTDGVEHVRYFLYKTLIPENKQEEYINKYKERVGEKTYNGAIEKYNSKIELAEKIKSEYVPKMKHSIDDFIELNRKLEAK